MKQLQRQIVFWFVTLLALPLAVISAGSLTACDAPLTFLAGEANGSGLTTSNWSGSQANAPTATYITARTQAEWEAAWALIGKPVPGALPDGKMAVAVLLGQRFTPDVRVEIVSAIVDRRRVGEPEHAVVVWREVAPPQATTPDQATAQAPSSPWAMRLMDATVLMPDFRQQAN